jgi:hypothetical protein
MIMGEVEASDESNRLFFNASNVQYEYSAVNGVISSVNKEFSYKATGGNDTLTFFSEQLTSGLKFKRVMTQLTIYIVPPMVVEHPAMTKDRSKNVSILALFTPKKPYIINVFYLHSQVQVHCSKAVACERGDNYVAVRYLKLGVGYVTIQDKKIYGSAIWNFEFTIVESDEVRVTGDKDYAQEGDLINLSVWNYYNGHVISPFTYEATYLQLVLSRNFRILEQKVNTFVLRAEHAGEYEIYAENTYPRILRSRDPFNISVYKQIKLNIKEDKIIEDEGFLIIEAKTIILLGCRRLIRVEGGPKEMVLNFSSDTKDITALAKDRRSLQVSSAKEGDFDIVIEAFYKGNKIALILVTVTVGHI